MLGRRSTSLQVTLSLGLAALTVALSGASTAAATPSGLQLARSALPELYRQAQSGVMPRTATASSTAPTGAISPNVEFLSNLPISTAISLGFIGNTVFVSTVLGIYSVDITDPTHPQLLGALPMYLWENEHMQVDPARNLLFIARDPRGFTSPATTAFPYGAVHVIDVSNPRLMVQIGFHLQPTGHTTSCINDCKFLWVSGPASPALLIPAGADPAWGGRPVWGLDITDPAHPVDCPHFIDLNNHNGLTGYDHVADVDAMGVAWVAGSGHIRGYWTQGQHLDPVTGEVRTATACDPIPYGGGSVNEGLLAGQGGIMHNSSRNLNLSVDGRRGDVLAATEEVTVTNCKTSGRFVTYDLGGSYAGQSWTAAGKDYKVRRLDTWTPQNQPGSSGCDSSHWFTDRGDGLIAIAFYSQGTRLLDISDPRHIREAGFFNVSGTNTWSAHWHGDNYIYVADFQRGLDILRYTGDRGVGTPGTRPAPPPNGSALGAVAGAAGTPNTSTASPSRWMIPAAPVGLALLGGLSLAHRRRRLKPPH
jgi:hypothetical protein